MALGHPRTKLVNLLLHLRDPRELHLKRVLRFPRTDIITMTRAAKFPLCTVVFTL